MARHAATPLDAAEAARRRDDSLTYDAVGATLAEDTLPAGWPSFTATRVVAGDLDRLADRVLRWQVQLGSGLRVATSDPVVRVGTVAVLHLGPLPIPVRVVRVLDEPDRRGFAYGTLPGHPEVGEELFSLERDEHGTVRMVVRAFSRPATLLARAGGPATTVFQRVMTRRYLRSLD
jgi:uncharacterized protein (UPF0548 family)